MPADWNEQDEALLRNAATCQQVDQMDIQKNLLDAATELYDKADGLLRDNIRMGLIIGQMANERKQERRGFFIASLVIAITCYAIGASVQ